jgi:U6 snRNA-associated Sm-like protein LSm7
VRHRGWLASPPASAQRNTHPSRPRLFSSTARAPLSRSAPPYTAVTGVLKGFDQLANLVLDTSVESLRDDADPYTLTGETRDLGLVVCKGKSVMCIMPEDGMEEIANPFLAPEET